MRGEAPPPDPAEPQAGQASKEQILPGDVLAGERTLLERIDENAAVRRRAVGQAEERHEGKRARGPTER